MKQVIVPEWNRHILWDLDDRNRLQAQMPSDDIFNWIAEFGTDCCEIQVLKTGLGFVFQDDDLALLFELTFLLTPASPTE